MVTIVTPPIGPDAVGGGNASPDQQLAYRFAEPMRPARHNRAAGNLPDWHNREFVGFHIGRMALGAWGHVNSP